LEPHHPDAGTTMDPHYAQFMHEIITSAENEEDECLIGADKCKRIDVEVVSTFCQASREFEETQAGEMEEQARAHGGVYQRQGGMSDARSGANAVAVARMALEDFVEDMTAMTVGSEMVHDFLTRCF
jgi:hypothetical protein